MSERPKSRTFMGEDEARPLVGLLNSKRRAKKRVEELVRMIASITRPSSRAPLKRIQEERAKEGPRVKFESGKRTFSGYLVYLGAVGTVEFTDKTGKPHRMVRTNTALEVKQATILMRINKELARYKVFPQLAIQLDDPWIVTRNWGNTPGVDAVHALVKLAEMGFLDRVRQCRNCGAWLFAKFRHNVFCGFKCQQKDFRSTPEWKRHRADYMRKKYWKRRPRR